jgi:diamine N-acetyltransferase
LNVAVHKVDGDNWKDCVRIRVGPGQERFVADTSFYLALCCYGDQGWEPLGLYVDDELVGFAMWAMDSSDGSYWIGALTIDHARQGRGVGRASMRSLIDWLRVKPNCFEIALSYRPENHVARSLYSSLGFVETGEVEGEELVARLRLPARS